MPQGVATLVALTGAVSFRTAPSVQHTDWTDGTVVCVEDADVEAETILELDASGVVQRVLLVKEQADAMETTNSFQSSRTQRKLRSSVNPASVKRMATTVLRSCRRT